MKDNLTIDYPPDFLAGWDGCDHLDCLPQCRIGLESGYCERIERAFADYQDAMERSDNGRNTGGKSYRGVEIIDRKIVQIGSVRVTTTFGRIAPAGRKTP